MARKRITATNETTTGRNTHFRDNYTGKNMTRKQLVNNIKKGNYSGYHIRKIHGIETPVSNPDKSKNNNLG